MIFPRLPFSIVDSVGTILSSVIETTIFLEENIDISDFPEVFSHDFQKNGSYITYRNAHKYIFTHLTYVNQDEMTRWIGSVGKKVVYDLSYIHSENRANLLLRLGWALYSFDYFRSDRSTKDIPIVLLTSDSWEIQDTLIKITALTLARDFVNLPPNAKSPKQFRTMIENLPWKNTDVQSYNDGQLRDVWYDLITAVAAGGIEGAQALVLRSKNSKQIDQVFVGKWVIFDAGGLQIKSDTGMLDMKCDMSGAASVIATLWYLDASEISHNFAWVVGIVDNLTGPNAFKPLDIYKAKNGMSVEIHHTDAEGRLVLADMMCLAIDELSPKKILTIATLTWACVVALGSRYSGIMGSDEETIDTLLHPKSSFVLERYWRLPYDEYYREKTKATIADLKNVTSGVKTGSTMGAAFLSNFCSDLPYTHIDIAWPAYLESPLDVFWAGATGAGVEALIHLATNRNHD